VSPYTPLLLKCALKFICIALNIFEQMWICIFYFLCTRWLRLWFVYVVFRRCLLLVLVQRLAILTEAFYSFLRPSKCLYSVADCATTAFTYCWVH